MIFAIIISVLIVFAVFLLYCCVRAGAKADEKNRKLFNQHKETHKP